MSLLDDSPSGQYASSISSPAIRVSDVSAPKRWLWALTASVAVLAVVAALVVWGPWRGGTESQQSVRFEVAQSDAMRFIYGGAMAVSPDGTGWYFRPEAMTAWSVTGCVRSTQSKLARSREPEARTCRPHGHPTAGMSDILASRRTPMTLIKKVDIKGGPPQVLSEMLGALNGATSSKEGVILFASSHPAPVFRILPRAVPRYRSRFWPRETSATSFLNSCPMDDGFST